LTTKEQRPSDDPAIFIPAKFDDFALTAQQFRIIAHIARRGECWESVDAMAKACRVHPDTILSGLKLLVRQNVIAKQTRPGQTCIYRVRPLKDWAPTESGHPPETKDDKGIPFKELPSRHLNGNCAVAAETENALITRIRDFVGQAGMAASGGLFRTLIRQNPGKFERVLADGESQVREGKKLQNPGGYFIDTWKRFK